MRARWKPARARAAVAAATVCALARAETPPRVRITYTSHGDCGTAEEFREAVRRRAPDLVDAAEGQPAREFAAEVFAADDDARGTVVITEASGATATRRLEGDDCQQVTDALAFIVAELGRSVRIDTEAPLETASPPTAVAPRSSQRVALPEPPRRERLVAGPRARWGAGFGMDAARAPAPGWLFGPIAYVELERMPKRVPLAFSVRLSASYATSGAIDRTIGDAEIRWMTARAEVCGFHLGSDEISLDACPDLDVGTLEGRGSGSALPKTEGALWLAPGALGRGRLTLERTLVVEIEAGAFVPLVRPRFYFGGGPSGAAPETIHEVGSVGFRMGARLGVLFP